MERTGEKQNIKRYVLIEVKDIIKYNETEGKLNPEKTDNDERLFLVLPNGKIIIIDAQYAKIVTVANIRGDEYGRVYGC